jgi:hypothetical protein
MSIIKNRCNEPIKKQVMRFLRFPKRSRGQAMVEFALISTVAMIVLLVSVQIAMIGGDAVDLGHMNYQGARWAAVNACATPAQVLQYILSVGSPTVTKSGGSCGTQLSMTLTDSIGGPATYTGSTCTTPTVVTGCANPRTFGTPVTITLSFDASKAIFLYGAGGATNKPWMGLINFPTTLTSTESAMAE